MPLQLSPAASDSSPTICLENDRYCKDLNDKSQKEDPTAQTVNPKELLERCDAPTFKGFLEWRYLLSKGRIKQPTTITIYWEHLSMLYSQETNN